MTSVEKTLFIEGIKLEEIMGNSNIPTALHYGKQGTLFDYDAIKMQTENEIVNINFKIELGEFIPKSNKSDIKYFETADDDSEKSVFGLTKDFFDLVLKNLEGQIDTPSDKKKGLKIKS